ncbi:GGDEF domain-containing protein [Niveispirillum sp. BGYR6]|uniref:GGDEF domain-containing protein n=1 Tax=Niveispirillum sp. BGYR6 TaxID=2971249 RepID=UPI0022B963A7|nr:GGDEF domain-containing protein [Niveispirillum sp. BGYR6]MDG5495982.1 GGDEF domain-containing protein [Niveispirillum sp. BGYR6]
MITLDIATVLFLYQSSLLVGALAFLLNRRQTGSTRGLGILSAALGLLGAGALLASLGEQALLPLQFWTLGSLTSGLWGHALLVVGLACLDRGRPPRRWGLLALLWPLPFWLAALLTQFHLQNHLRAIIFHLNAALWLALAAWVIQRGRRLEPLPSRGPLALVLGGSALSFAAGAAIILWVADFVPWLALEFCVQILGNFTLVILVSGMATDRAEAQLCRQANLDALTGIGNRRWLAASLPTSLRTGDTVLCLDLDHFKQINDRHGHAGGDVALVAVASLLRDSLRQGDCLARMGGEEFVLFLPELEEQQALLVAERLRAAIAALAVSYRGQPIPVTTSIGLARCDRAGRDWQDLHHAADMALYAAKQAGRNRVQLAGPIAVPPLIPISLHP